MDLHPWFKQATPLRACKRFAAFLKRSPDTATAEDIRLFQLHLSEAGASICNRNCTMTGLRFLFRVTLRRLDLAACWIKARKLWLEAEDLDDAREMRAWRSIAIAFLALGVNKQLDLQTALTEVGRVLANSQGWYAQRQSVQVVRSLAWSPLSFW